MVEIVEIKNNKFHLLPEKAIWWEEKNTLLISDVHLGKVSHFRKEGIAIPSAAINENFKRLDFLFETYNPVRVIFLGDLFHHRINIEWHLFTSWRKKHSQVEMVLILGNHDLISKKEFTDHGINPVSGEMKEGNFRFCHFPNEEPDHSVFSFCGHVHPVFTLESARQSLRLPCFVYRTDQMILPGFGVFTGGFNMAKEEAEIFFLVADSEVIMFKP
jgi:DNA ligase-associated metallophosphoesterase